MLPRSLRTHTYHSSSSLQPPVAAASQPGRALSTSPARTQQQQTCQNQRPNACLRQRAIETPARGLTTKRFMPTQTTHRCRLEHSWRQLLSHSERSTHHLHAHSKNSCTQTAHLSFAKLHAQASLTLLKPTPPPLASIRGLEPPARPQPHFDLTAAGAAGWLSRTAAAPARCGHLLAKPPHPLG